MTYRLAKKRTLQKEGFVHVSGWVSAADAADIQATIDAAAPKIVDALARALDDKNRLDE